MESHNEIWSDPSFWVATATVVFAVLAFKPIRKALCNMLDSRSARIGKELAEAEALKNEARTVLESYQKKYHEAVKESEEIVDTARREAAMIIENAKKDIDSAVKKRMELVLQRIAQAEKAALNDIQHNAIDIAVNATRMIVKERLEQGSADDLVHAAISDLQRKLH